MKTIFKIALFNFLGIVFTSNIITAQNVTAPVDRPKASRENLSKEQISILKSNRAKQIEFRNEFRETLTGNQLDMLTNPRLTREDKIKSFRASLSDNQVMMVRTNRKQIRAQNFILRTTVSDQQRMRIRRLALNRAQQNRALYMRARLRHRFHKI